MFPLLHPDTVITNWTAARMNIRPAFFNLCSAGGVHSFNVIGGISLAVKQIWQLLQEPGLCCKSQIKQEGSHTVGPGSTHKYAYVLWRLLISYDCFMLLRVGQEGVEVEGIKNKVNSIPLRAVPRCILDSTLTNIKMADSHHNHKYDRTPSSVIIWHIKLAQRRVSGPGGYCRMMI